MLHKYAFSNFQSFLERTEVDFTINQKTVLTDWMAKLDSGDRVSKLMAIIGPNASGKTAILKPIAFMSWFTSRSFLNAPEAGIPVTPHASAQSQPTELECTLDIDGQLWRYELRCNSEKVLHEALYQKRTRFNYVFIREWDESSKSYDVKQQNFGLAPQEARKVRQNVSLISWAAQFGVPLAVELAESFVVTNVNILGRIPMGENALLSAAQHFSGNSSQRDRMTQLLASWDLGLSGIELRELTIHDPQRTEEKVWMPFGKHKGSLGEFELPFMQESSGTQGAFVLMARLLSALEFGGLAVIDEFENDLHPHMIEPILDLFANPTTNPHQAQLLFTCHAIEVLNIVHKSQVMLIEKDENCESSAIRMDAIEGIRNDDNYYAKYMAGAYRAVPNF